MSDHFSWVDFSKGSPDSIKHPVFSEPWEADTFAMLVALEKLGLITWLEWAEVLGAEIKCGSSENDTGADYYLHVLSALENLLNRKNIVSNELLKQYQAGWARVADRTPHGQPLELTLDDLTQSDQSA
ncbi:MAG: nitrile hydratase accessory protein [Proteobacteria bacterium]|nr:nitrile hydratase accessory protein [Pseudomonadota bacterium]